MAEGEAKVRVRIDTRQAKGELRDLTKEGARTAGRVGQGLRRIVGRGLAVAGLGAGVAAAQAAIRGPTQSGIAAIASQTFGPLGARLMNAITGGYGPEAMGKAIARDKIINQYGPLAGLLKKIPEGARTQFDFESALEIRKQRGIWSMQQDPQFANAFAKKLDEWIDTIKALILALNNPKSLYQKFNAWGLEQDRLRAERRAKGSSR